MKSEEAIQRRHLHSEVGLAEVLQVVTILGVSGGVWAQWLAEALGLTWNEGANTPMPASTDTSGDRSVPSALSALADPDLPEVKHLRLLEQESQDPIVFEQ